MAGLKALGVVAGTTDFIFYYKGVLHAWDIKVGNDKLRPEQIDFIDKVTNNGGEGREIRSFEEFVELIKSIVNE